MPNNAEARRETWFDVDGVRLFALDVGEGRPIVFIHGGLADHRSALHRAGALGRSHRLLLPDLRGSGRSVYAGALSWEQLADDVAALLDQVGLERAIIAGTSMGSAVALSFALRHAQRTRGLLLVSPVYPGQDRGLNAAQVAAMQAMATAGERAVEQGMNALLPLYDRLPSPIRETAIAMMLGFDAASVATTTRLLASLEQPIRTASELESIEAPALVVPGTDPEHPAELGELYVRYLRRARLIEPTSPDLMDQLARFCDELR